MKTIDYVTFYAERMREDARVFKQQKQLIDSQYAASVSFFSNLFGTKEAFKKNARRYLRERGVLH